MMTQTKYENILFFVTIANIVLGITVVVLGTLALTTIRTCNRMIAAMEKKEPVKTLVRWEDRPQTMDIRKPPVRPSVLLESRRRFQDDLWS